MVAASFQDEKGRGPAEPAGEAGDAGSAFRLLGGGKLFKNAVRNSLDAHDVIMAGISSRALAHLVENVGILSSGDTLAKAIGISLRTLQRKSKTVEGDDLLSTEQSSRPWQFVEILANGIFCHLRHVLCLSCVICHTRIRSGPLLKTTVDQTHKRSIMTQP